MPLNVNAGGSWRTASKVYAKVADAWVNAKELWAYMSGGWRSAWKNEIRYVNTANRTGASVHELMGSPTQPNTYIFENQATISAGVGSYALRTGVFPAGSTLVIINKGVIQGKGGSGGAFNVAGGAGGNALYIDYPCTIDNGLGYIYGGGGGGGGVNSVNGGYYLRTAGGGGAGATGGDVSTTSTNATTLSGSNLVQAGVGSSSAGGSGGVINWTIAATIYLRQYGGAGGAPGSAGVAGTYAITGVSYSSSVTASGAAGSAISRNGYTVTITAGNDTTHIKGAVI
ncbi:hypothetical protein [Pseudomonas sp. Sample_16]|uniref:hypothetical protein n=1 Tax=Pseudomonas sp. Sample_16 TaxID=2448263 RepID=UPI001032C8F6|nr:hypothetical protein [Pseudomonas sp. Sample_16]